MDGKVRRVVTGHDRKGRAIVVSDGLAPSVRTNPKRPGQYSTEVWRTEGAPAPIVADEADPTLGPRKLMPPEHGTVVRITQFAPEPEAIRNLDPESAKKMFADMGHGSASTFEAGGRHPMIHRTETVDYAIIVSGEITLVLDDEDLLVRAGDVVVQRGTNHAWSNRSAKPCTVAFILIDGGFDADLGSKFEPQ